MAPPGIGTELVEFDSELESVAGDHLPAKACLVDPPEKGDVPGVPGFGEHGDGPELRECLDHEDAGKSRAPGEMAGEESLVSPEAPEARGRTTGLEGSDLINEEKRRPVREKIGRLRQRAQWLLNGFGSLIGSGPRGLSDPSRDRRPRV